jgi:hypothetical protein
MRRQAIFTSANKCSPRIFGDMEEAKERLKETRMTPMENVHGIHSLDYVAHLPFAKVQHG